MICSEGDPKSDKTGITAQKPLSDMREHIRNAQLLLSYASEAGINVEPEVIQSVVEAKNACESDTDRTDPVGIEVKFWQATEKLAKSVSPVTVASLRASYDIQEDSSYTGLLRALILRSPRNISQAKLTVRRYRLLTLLTLIVLLIVQVYWVVGSSVTNEVASSIDQWRKDQDEKAKVQRELEILKSSLASPNIERQKRDELATKHEERFDALNRIEAKMETHQINSKLNYDILDHWNMYWSRPSNFLLHIFQTQLASSSPDSGDAYEKLMGASKKANIVLHALQVYLLPILYGLLGSITYVLRTLGSQIKNLSYTAESDIGYRLRMILGALAGLSIAWFVQPGKEAAELKVFTTLSPFAIAFLAGYGIELLFSAMDRLIAAFTSASAGK